MEESRASYLCLSISTIRLSLDVHNALVSQLLQRFHDEMICIDIPEPYLPAHQDECDFGHPSTPQIRVPNSGTVRIQSCPLCLFFDKIVV